MYQKAVKGCTLQADCAQKAVVAFFVQQALQNTSNAFLAFAGNQTRDFTSHQDFVQRQQLFTATLQQVAAANAGLTDSFLTINQFADQTQVERNKVNGVRGMRKVGVSKAPTYNVGLTEWMSAWLPGPAGKGGMVAFPKSLHTIANQSAYILPRISLQDPSCLTARRSRLLLALSPPGSKSPPSPMRSPPRSPPQSIDSFPSSLDWRNSGVVPPVLDQVGGLVVHGAWCRVCWCVRNAR